MEDIKAMFAWIESHPDLARVDAVICNASFIPSDRLMDGNVENWDKMCKVSFEARFLTIYFIFVIFRSTSLLQVSVPCWLQKASSRLVPLVIKFLKNYKCSYSRMTSLTAR